MQPSGLLFRQELLFGEIFIQNFNLRKSDLFIYIFIRRVSSFPTLTEQYLKLTI